MTSEPDSDEWFVPPDFLDVLQAARRRVTNLGLVATILGGLGLAYMLGLAATGLSGPVSLVKLIFVGASAVSAGIGLGLLNISGGARAAGSAWFLAWGVTSLIVGFAATYTGDSLLGLFALVTGATQSLFSALLASPEVVFLCDYGGGQITEEAARKGLQAAMTGDSTEMQVYAYNIIHPSSPVTAPPDDRT